MGDQEFVDVHSVPAVVDSAMTDPVVVTGEETYKVPVAAAEHEDVGNENGNGDSSVAVVDEQVAVEEVPVPTTEEDRLWAIVKENAADFNAWTALIQETEKLVSSPCPVKPFLTICISIGLSMHYIENWGKFAIKANRDFTLAICIYSLIQAGLPVSFSWARVTAVRNKF
jgi:hypothetical protein